MPGCFSPTEILTAWDAGADVVKVFPATALGPGLHQGRARAAAAGQADAHRWRQRRQRRRLDPRRRRCRRRRVGPARPKAIAAPAPSVRRSSTTARHAIMPRHVRARARGAGDGTDAEGRHVRRDHAAPQPARVRAFLAVTAVLSATFGGGEANVAVSLAQFGARQLLRDASCPKHAIGDAAVRALRSRRRQDRLHPARRRSRRRLLHRERARAQRASTVIYDRAGSAISEMKPEDGGLVRMSSPAPHGFTSPASRRRSASAAPRAPHDALEAAKARRCCR